jgi:putative PIN family toxin of toxin-antitoxin system
VCKAHARSDVVVMGIHKQRGCAPQGAPSLLSISTIDITSGTVYNTIMHQIVIDTNILIAALRSQRGASYKLISLAGSGFYQLNLSTPLVLEYQDVALRMVDTTALETEDVLNIIDYLCTVATHRYIYFLWRPFLRDPKDDMVLELAVSAGCPYIVTFNMRDFQGAEQFGVQPIAPRDFLRLIGAVP